MIYKNQNYMYHLLQILTILIFFIISCNDNTYVQINEEKMDTSIYNDDQEQYHDNDNNNETKENFQSIDMCLKPISTTDRAHDKILLHDYIINQDIFDNIELYIDWEIFKRDLGFKKFHGQESIKNYVKKIVQIRKNQIIKIYKDKKKKLSDFISSIDININNQTEYFNTSISNIISEFTSEVYIEDFIDLMDKEDLYENFLKNNIINLEIIHRKIVLNHLVDSYINDKISVYTFEENYFRLNDGFRYPESKSIIMTIYKLLILKFLLCSTFISEFNLAFIHIENMKKQKQSQKYSLCCCIISKLCLERILCFGFYYDCCCFRRDKNLTFKLKNKKDKIFEDLKIDTYMFYPGLVKPSFYQNCYIKFCDFIRYIKKWSYNCFRPIKNLCGKISNFVDYLCCNLVNNNCKVCLEKTVNFKKIEDESDPELGD